MPSYQYSAPSIYRQRLPPTPPEDRMQHYTNSGMNNMAYQHGGYQDSMAPRRHDDRGYDYSSRYSHSHQHQHQSATVMYQHPYYNSGTAMSSTAPHNSMYYRPALGPILPPIRGYETHHHTDQSQSYNQVSKERPNDRQQEKRDDKPVGGVSAKLDYDMEVMTDFVTETSQAIIALNGATPPGLRKWIHQVLSATRLPSSTILLAFDYLSEHMRNIQSPYAAEAGEDELQRLLTTALILGSKFLDDNTFINKSWAEVSNIEVHTLNWMELEWLKEINFRLHRDPNSQHGFQSYLVRWKHFEANRSVQQMQSKQASLNANGQVWKPRYLCSPQNAASFSPQGIYSPSVATTSYPTPAFSNYVPYSSRSANTSPPSAPYSGPTTPEYHGQQTNWGSLNGNLTYSTLPATTCQPTQPTSTISRSATQAPPFVPMAFSAAPVYSGNHGPECFCVPCNRQFMMVPHFGLPQSVAG